MVVRLVAIALCAVCGVLLSTARFRQWDNWNAKTQDHWWALCGWVFLGAYDTIENIVQNNAVGSRLVVLLLVAAVTLRALLRSGDLTAKSIRETKKEEA